MIYHEITPQLLISGVVTPYEVLKCTFGLINSLYTSVTLLANIVCFYKIFKVGISTFPVVE
jgi:hypothetical protein